MLRKKLMAVRCHCTNHNVAVLTYCTSEVSIVIMRLANVVRGDIEVAVIEIVGSVVAHKIHSAVLTGCVVAISFWSNAGRGVVVFCTI